MISNLSAENRSPSYLHLRRTPSQIDAIILTHYPNPFHDSLRSSQFNNLAMQPRSSTPSPLLPPSPPPPPNIGSTSNQGVRSSQEDRYAVHNFTTSSGVEMTLCGIFDGHCGDQASEFCALNLLRVFTSCLSLQSTVINAVKSTFTQLDHEFCTLAKENVWESGTTAIIVVLHGDKLTCGNVGDCRAVVGRGEEGGGGRGAKRRLERSDSKTLYRRPT